MLWFAVMWLVKSVHCCVIKRLPILPKHIRFSMESCCSIFNFLCSVSKKSQIFWQRKCTWEAVYFHNCRQQRKPGFLFISGMNCIFNLTVCWLVSSTTMLLHNIDERYGKCLCYIYKWHVVICCDVISQIRSLLCYKKTAYPPKAHPVFNGPLEGKFLLITLVIVRITLNVIVHQMPLNVC
jgi:hypothetical protein